MENIVTYKIKYTCTESDRKLILQYMKEYNSLLKCTYNELYNHPQYSMKELYNTQKQLNNISLDFSFKSTAVFEAKRLVSTQSKCVCFGKHLYKKYNSGLITKEELQINRLVPLYVLGNKDCPKGGNRKFYMETPDKIIFKKDKHTHIILNLIHYKNYLQDLVKLKNLQDCQLIPITYRLDLEYIYITFDLNKIREIGTYKFIKNRIFAIDMNPNYIGYSIVDWQEEMKYKIVSSGVISIKQLNDYDNSLNGKGLPLGCSERNYVTHKRSYEIVKIGQRLVNLCKHYKCHIFCMEDLKMTPKDIQKGKGLNRLINKQWNRRLLTKTISKYCNLNGIKLETVPAAFSSFLGNLIYKDDNLPDMVLASIEIGRRAYEFLNQYIYKTKSIKKNIIFPDLTLVKDRVNHALEVLGYSESWNSLQKLYYSLKNLKLKYRVSLEDVEFSKVFSIPHNRRYWIEYIYM